MRVEKLRSAFDIDVVFRHFPLHPDTPAEGMSLEELFAGRAIDVGAAQARLSAAMLAEGLPYGTRTMTYNSRLAQELAAWSETQANGQAIHDALFRAYFVDNINLGKVENLTKIAASVGLSSSNAETALQERQFRSNVDTDWSRSRELGITGVPTFVMAGRGLAGAQPLEQLQKFVAAGLGQ